MNILKKAVDKIKWFLFPDKTDEFTLYFSYHNGYECVKRNSKKSPTIFDSVYKIVADTVLEQEKYEAKSRTGEDNIQIHLL